MIRTLMTVLALAAAASLAVSCSFEVRDNPFFDTCRTPVGPCVISSDSTVLVVRDYFPGIGRVDALTCEDYTVVPMSGNGMDTVLIVASPVSRKVSMVKVVSGDESGVIVLKRKPSPEAAVPSVYPVGTNMGGREFTVRVTNSPAIYLVLWQNTPLDHKFLSYRRNGEFTVRIPMNALEMERSYIHIYSYNAEGAGNAILVPVRDGRVAPMSLTGALVKRKQ